MDKRLNAFRPDLADARLQGSVDATCFVLGREVQFRWPVASVHRMADAGSMQLTQALMGETAVLFEDHNGWAWVQLTRDSYVGYVCSEALGDKVESTTHHVHVVSTLIYPKPDLKTQPVVFLPMNAAVAVVDEEGAYSRLATGGYVFSKHLTSKKPKQDFVNVAEKFLHVPYLWGGKTHHGLDCSGLLQTALHAVGTACPRDTDMQEASLGTALQINDLDGLTRGDLVFWQGHVGIMHDESNLLHANGFHMQTVIEPLKLAATRIADSHKPITALKRL
ncbi:MAG: C40 family peptidase [Alphaproteobacteria bacterium]|nr:C40 family peptidase [Alphaproteobacteria bacterium]